MHFLLVYHDCWNKKNHLIQILIPPPPHKYTLKTSVFKTVDIHPTLYLPLYITRTEIETKTGKLACLFHLSVKQKYE